MLNKVPDRCDPLIRDVLLAFFSKLFIGDGLDQALFPCITQLSLNFISINVKMPTIAGILTFISMINTTSERPKARHLFIHQYFSFLCS